MNLEPRKTIQRLVESINGHRTKFYKCLRGVSPDRTECDDEFVLGRHLLLCHGLRDKRCFNENLIFTILEHCSLRSIDVSEHKWIQKLKCLKPFGLNAHNPYGIPLVL